MAPQGRRNTLGLAMIAALLAVTLLASHFGPDQLSCVETYVDGQSGRLKHVRYIAMAPVWEWEEETPYSRRVHAILGPTPPADGICSVLTGRLDRLVR